LIAAKLPEISAVRPDLTLEGLRLVWQQQAGRRAQNKIWLSRALRLTFSWRKNLLMPEQPPPRKKSCR